MPAPLKDNGSVPCRFKSAGRGGWQDGLIRKWNADGTIDLTESRNGATRTLRPEWVEVLGTGPRGGTIWEGAVRPMDPQPAPD